MVNINRGFWGVVFPDHDKGEIIFTQKYYAFEQFLSYIRLEFTTLFGNGNCGASLDKSGKKLIIVATNTY